MIHARRMIETNPSQAPMDTEALMECIEACFDYAQACSACADTAITSCPLWQVKCSSSSYPVH